MKRGQQYDLAVEGFHRIAASSAARSGERTLASKTCVTCRAHTPPLGGEEVERLCRYVPLSEVVDDDLLDQAKSAE